MQKLVGADGEIDLFEYVLQKIVLRHLEPHFAPARKPVIQYYSFKPLLPDCAVLLSALAYVGQDEPEKIQDAFQQGAQPLSQIAQAPLQLVPQDACELEQVDAALNRLALAAPQIKKNVLDACAQTVERGRRDRGNGSRTASGDCGHAGLPNAAVLEWRVTSDG